MSASDSEVAPLRRQAVQVFQLSHLRVETYKLAVGNGVAAASGGRWLQLIEITGDDEMIAKLVVDFRDLTTASIEDCVGFNSTQLWLSKPSLTALWVVSWESETDLVTAGMRINNLLERAETNYRVRLRSIMTAETLLVDSPIVPH